MDVATDSNVPIRGSRLASVISIIAQAGRRFARHHGDSLGAAIAFQTILAMAPLLIVAVAILAIVVGDGAARAELLSTVHRIVGPQATATIGDWLDVARSSGGTATIIGTVLFLFGADRLIAEVDVALDVVFAAAVETEKPWKHHMLKLLVDRGIGVAMTLGLGLWIAGSLAMSMGIGELVPEAFHGLVGPVQALLSYASLVVVLAVVYHVLPPCKLGWRHVFLGALVTAALLSLVGWLLKIWFTHANVGAGYGAAGSVVVVLVWLRVSADVFVFGAEINAVLVERGHSEGGIDS